MKQVIYKFDVETGPAERFRRLMPKGSSVMTVQMQAGKAVMWAQVDPEEAETELREFVTRGTGIHFEVPGYDSEENYWESWIGTVQDGPFVWHVFEVYR